MSQEPTLLMVVEKLDQLSNRVELGFSNSSEKFKSIDRQFDSVNKQFDGINKKFDGINKRLDLHEEFFTSIKQTLNSLESKVATKVQLNGLIDVLQENKVISSYEAKTVKAIS